MDADTLKILIGASAVIISGLGGQWFAGRNSRLSAQATHERDRQKWAIELKYKTYVLLIEQVEDSFALLSRARNGDPETLGEALASINGWKAPEIRLVGSDEVRAMFNELGADFRKWYRALLAGELTAEEISELRSENLKKFQDLVTKLRTEVAPQ